MIISFVCLCLSPEVSTEPDCVSVACKLGKNVPSGLEWPRNVVVCL